MKLFSKKVFIGICASMLILGASLNVIYAQNARKCDSIKDPQEKDVCIQSYQRYVDIMQRYTQRINGARLLTPKETQEEGERCSKMCSEIPASYFREACFRGCFIRSPYQD